MEGNHTSYDNLDRWKIVRTKRSWSIVPAPNKLLWHLLIWPLGAFLGFICHSIPSFEHRWFADIFVLAVCLLMTFLVIREWNKLLEDLRPHLVVDTTGKRMDLPRIRKNFPLDETGTFFIAFDCFEGGDSPRCELNLVEIADGQETLTPILHTLGQANFDRMCKGLQELGVPFKSRIY